jgi:hypothetical protein
VVIQGVKRIAQAVVKVRIGRDLGKQDLQNIGIGGKFAHIIQLKNLMQDPGDHGNTGFSMAQFGPSRVERNLLINHVNKAASFEIMSQNRGIPDRLSLDGWGFER